MQLTIVAAALAALSLTAAAPGAKPPTPAPADRPAGKPIQLAAMCPKIGDTMSQMNRICTYRCLNGAVAITIPSTQLCPLSIDR
jgi:hypothetical protein